MKTCYWRGNYYKLEESEKGQNIPGYWRRAALTRLSHCMNSVTQQQRLTLMLGQLSKFMGGWVGVKY